MLHNVNADLSLTYTLRPEYVANPYPLYHNIRRIDPILWDDPAGWWTVTRYVDVMNALRDTRFSAVRFSLTEKSIPEELHTRLGPAVLALTRQMLFLDPPDHTRLRGLLLKAFTPRVVEAMRPHIQQIVDELLDKATAKKEIELIKEFAYPLPAIVIAELLGVPSQDRDQFTQWTGNFGKLINGTALPFQEVLQALSGVADFMDYFRTIIKQRDTEPRDDLMQAMINAEEHGTRLSEQELLGNCVLLLAAGHGTTTHLIGNGMLALLENPDQLQMLKNNPSLATTAVAELLRYDSPVQMTSRTAREDLELGGKRISAGQQVMLCLGAANRDPEQFADPDRLDIQRSENRHLAFGHGIHFCLGAPLARVEAEIAFNTLLQRLPELQLATDQVERSVSLVFRGLQRLSIRYA